MESIEVKFKRKKEVKALNKLSQSKGMDKLNLLRKAFRFYYDYEILLKKHNGDLDKVHKELRKMAKDGLCLVHEGE